MNTTPFLVACLIASSVLAAAAPSVDGTDLRIHLEYLAADERGGRGLGSDGIDQTEQYIARWFEESGLEPFQPSKWFVEFDIRQTRFDVERSHGELTTNGDRHGLLAPDDFVPLPFSGEGSVDADIVFAGYGIRAPEFGYDDYADLDVIDKVVLVLRYEPGHSDPSSEFDGVATTSHALFTRKAELARELGARALLVVTGPNQVPRREELNWEAQRAVTMASSGDDDTSFVAVRIAHRVIAPLFDNLDLDLQTIQDDLDARRGWRAALPGAHLELTVQREENESTRARNVVGVVRGRDPELRDEWIVIGAHHDHLGTRDTGRDRIYNGADDNASGTAVVLQLARAWADRSPARSLLFVTFSAEESGLLGSRAMLTQGSLDLNSVQFMINLDMVGRNPGSPLRVYGDGYARGLEGLVRDANEGPRIDLEFAGLDMPANSDHAPFFEANIPVLAFFSGFHAQYHRVGDEVDHISIDRMTDVANLTSRVIGDLANEAAIPRFLFRVGWLGVELAYDGQSSPVGARVLSVQDGSPAQLLGFHAGDLLTAAAGSTVDSGPAIDRQIVQLPTDSSATIEVVGRDGNRSTIDIRRPVSGFLGVQFEPLSRRERDRLELPFNRGALVVDVLPDAPAREAGLRASDVIVAVNGLGVNDETLPERLSQIGAGKPTEIRVLRDGRQLDLTAILAVRP